MIPPATSSDGARAEGAGDGSSFADRGFLLGDGLFETIRLYGDAPFRLDAHLDRLRAGAARVGIAIPRDLDERLSAALDAWRARRGAGDRNGALRLTLTRGIGEGVLPDEDGRPTLVITTARYMPDRELPVRGLTALLRGRVDERALTAGLKGIGYLERIVALREARAGGAREALLVNSRGRVVEGSASNLFAVRNGVLHTPSVAEGALPGVTRDLVLDLAEARGVHVVEGAMPPDELVRADEIFLTSSLRELAPVVKVEGETIGAGVPGRLVKALQRDFDRVVRKSSSRSGNAGE